jgi:carboxylesterase type B
MPPTKPAPWQQVRDAVKPGPRAVQAGNAAFGKMNIFEAPLIGAYFSGGRSDAAIARENDGENCLLLNVLTPALKGRRPVMVYIHGGGGKVSTLMAMPAAKRLFHRAIVESGSMLSVRTREAAIEDTKALYSLDLAGLKSREVKAGIPPGQVDETTSWRCATKRGDP